MTQRGKACVFGIGAEIFARGRMSRAITPKPNSGAPRESRDPVQRPERRRGANGFAEDESTMFALGASGRGARPVTTQQTQGAPKTSDLMDWMRAITERGDRAAFARLFDHFAPRLIAFFGRAGMPRDAAEEVAQETMISVWTKARLYNPAEAGVSTWIYTIARNARIDRLRREGRRSKLETEAAVEDDDILEVSSEDYLLSSERDERVRSTVDVLPPEQAQVVRLSFFAEKPHAEIARELGIPLGTVKSRLRLAMAKIRAAWEDER